MEDALIVNLLKKEHPSVFESIASRLKNVFKDHRKASQAAIRAFYYDYCTYKDIDTNKINWHINPTLRREMVAMMLLRFNPERIHGISERGVARGLLKELSSITGISQPLYSNDVGVVCDYFKVYTDYRNNALTTFEKINENN